MGGSWMGAGIVAMGCLSLAASPVEPWALDLGRRFPGWKVVTPQDLRKGWNANAPAGGDPGTVGTPLFRFALIYREAGDRRHFRLVARGAPGGRWAVVHEEDNFLTTAFCWIEPVVGRVHRDGEGRSWTVDPDRAVTFSFDGAYVCLFVQAGRRWRRIVTLTED